MTLTMNSQWQTGVCDCCSDMNSCWDGCCCTLLAITRQMDAVKGIPNSMNFNGCFFIGNCCPSAYLLNIAVRCNIAGKYDIPENGCVTCLVGTFCCPCGVCQQHRELEKRGIWAGGTCCARPPTVYIMDHTQQQKQPSMGGDTQSPLLAQGGNVQGYRPPQRESGLEMREAEEA